VTATKPPSFHQRLLHALHDWRRRAVTRRRARDDVLLLAGMSDHDLRDLGIGRSEVPELVDRNRY